MAQRRVLCRLYGTASSDDERTEHFVNNFYRGAYGRDATSTEIQQQRDALNAAAAQSQSAVQTQAETFGRGLFAGQVNDSSISDTQFVTNLYEAFLQRGPDAGGLGWWSGQATVGTGRQNVLGAFATCSAFRDLSGTLYREANWLVSDHLGTPRMIVNKSGSLASVKRHDYLPFGEELSAGTGGRTTTKGYTADNVRQKFTSKERDSETGLDYFIARYYSAASGRFTSTDPFYFQTMMVIDPQRFNLYANTRNNPLKWVDPSGEKLYLRGNKLWLRLNVLYEMAGGQENFDRYFNVVDGQVVARPGVDSSGANAGVMELLDLVNSAQNYIFFAGSEGEEAADLFKGSRDRKGKLDRDGKALVKEFEGDNDQHAGGSLGGTTGRSGSPQPADLANGDPVFAVIAINTDSEFTQVHVDYRVVDTMNIATSGCSAVECSAQRSGAGQVIRPVSFFIHEATENQEFARVGSDNSNYHFAHQHALHREAQIRSALHITGGFAGGDVQRKVPRQ